MTFLRLLARDLLSRTPGMLLSLCLLLLVAFLVSRFLPTPLASGAALLGLGVFPLVAWLFGGLSVFWPDFARGSHLLWRMTGVSGLTVVAARYLRLLLEVALLLGGLIAAALNFGALSAPLAEVQFTAEQGRTLLLITLPFLLAPPAVALTAGVMGHASRLRALGGLAAFAALWGALIWLTLALSASGPRITVQFAGLPPEICALQGGCAVQASTYALLLQPLFALLNLWLAGRILDSAE